MAAGLRSMDHGGSARELVVGHGSGRGYGGWVTGVGGSVKRWGRGQGRGRLWRRGPKGGVGGGLVVDDGGPGAMVVGLWWRGGG